MLMISRLLIFLASCLVIVQAQAGSDLHHVDLHDLFLGEVLYDAYQNKYFTALSKLDNELDQYNEVDEKQLDPLHYNIGQAKFLVGDLELRYRMNLRAGKAIQAVLGKGIDQATRNFAALQLARVFFKKSEPKRALYALNLIRYDAKKSRYEMFYSLGLLRHRPPNTFKKRVKYLRALASIDTGQYSRAIKILQNLKKEKLFRGFALYNLGIAQIKSGHVVAGEKTFDALGQIETSDKGLLALKDKANIKLAYRYVRQNNVVLAKKYFERVRLHGPYSNKALLGSGWIAISQGKFDRALVPWTLLHGRSKIDQSVQEAMMAVPYAYGKLKAYGRSANLYGQAMDVFSRQIGKLDTSIKSIRNGDFLKALLNKRGNKDKNWVVNLRQLKGAPETRYILDLMASNNFQESYKNYRDMENLRHILTKWLNDLDTFEDLIEKRRQYQQPLLPVIEKKFRKIDARMKLRLEQRDNLNTKIQNMLIAPRPEYLATANERIALDKLTRIKDYLTLHPAKSTAEIKSRVARLNGVLLWSVRTEFDQRLTDAYKHLHTLDGVIKKLKVQYYSFIRTRQAATQSYEGYTILIRQLRTRLYAAQKKLNSVMAKQGRVINTMAENSLSKRRKRLEEYQIKARFALAESYDRATKSQRDKEIEIRHKNSAINQSTEIKNHKTGDQPVTKKADTSLSIKQQLKVQQGKIKSKSNLFPHGLWSGKKHATFPSKKRNKKPWIRNAINPYTGDMQ